MATPTAGFLDRLQAEYAALLEIEETRLLDHDPEDLARRARMAELRANDPVTVDLSGPICRECGSEPAVYKGLCASC